MAQGNSQNVTLNERDRTRHFIYHNILRNIKMGSEKEERWGERGERGREGKIKWKEILAVVISLLKMIWKDLTAKSAISPKML